jgi:ankyrin repeat protein
LLRFFRADGYLPLHWAVNQDTPNIDVIAALIAANASASAKACNKGSLPLHWCVNR